MKLNLSLALSLTVILGLILGLGTTTFVQGKGFSYFYDSPEACLNCHIMQDQYASWSRSSHKDFTTCNSCHAPENPALALLYKAENGFNHSWKFTTGVHSDPIIIRPHNKLVAHNACMNCHQHLFKNQNHPHHLDNRQSCLSCHDNVGHPHSKGR